MVKILGIVQKGRKKIPKIESLGIVARGRKWSPRDIMESVIKPYSQRVLNEDII